jgi:hypothetical protein
LLTSCWVPVAIGPSGHAVPNRPLAHHGAVVARPPRHGRGRRPPVRQRSKSLGAWTLTRGSRPRESPDALTHHPLVGAQPRSRCGIASGGDTVGTPASSVVAAATTLRGPRSGTASSGRQPSRHVGAGELRARRSWRSTGDPRPPEIHRDGTTPATARDRATWSLSPRTNSRQRRPPAPPQANLHPPPTSGPPSLAAKFTQKAPTREALRGVIR